MNDETLAENWTRVSGQFDALADGIEKLRATNRRIEELQLGNMLLDCDLILLAAGIDPRGLRRDGT